MMHYFFPVQIIQSAFGISVGKGPYILVPALGPGIKLQPSLPPENSEALGTLNSTNNEPGLAALKASGFGGFVT
jgi:hypothetical protein